MQLTGPEAIEMKRQDFLETLEGSLESGKDVGGLHKGRGVQVQCHSQSRKGAGPQHR